MYSAREPARIMSLSGQALFVIMYSHLLEFFGRRQKKKVVDLMSGTETPGYQPRDYSASVLVEADGKRRMNEE